MLRASVTAAVEPNHRFVAFTKGTYPSMYSKSHGSMYDTAVPQVISTFVG